MMDKVRIHYKDGSQQFITDVDCGDKWVHGISSETRKAVWIPIYAIQKCVEV